ncbi:hypothetical protein Tco_1326323 [Tanacetum coccineum]
MFVDHMHHPWRTLAAIINKENVDYPELIWEDLAYQIDYKKEKRSRRENMPYPRFTKIIINHFLKQHKSLTNLNHKHFHTIKDDGISRRNHTVSDEIYSDDPDVALELAKSISQTEAEEAEAQGKVSYNMQDRTESAKKILSGKSSNSVFKLKGAPSLTLAEQEATNIMQALKERVPNESTSSLLATSSEELVKKQGFSMRLKDITKEKVILEWGDEQDSEFSNEDNDDDEKDDKDGDADDKGNDHAVEMKDAEGEESDKGEEKSYVPAVVDSYLDTKVEYVFQKELQKHMTDLIHKYSLQHLPELTKKPTPTIEQESKISPLEILKIKKEQAESQKNPQFTIKSTDKAALKEYDLKNENAMDKGVADTVKDHKRKHYDEDDEDPPARPNQGKKTNRRRTKEFKSSMKPSTTKETPNGKSSNYMDLKVVCLLLQRTRLKNLLQSDNGLMLVIDDSSDDNHHKTLSRTPNKKDL